MRRVSSIERGAGNGLFTGNEHYTRNEHFTGNEPLTGSNRLHYDGRTIDTRAPQ